MMHSRQKILRRFIDRPPILEGGLALSIEPLDDNQARLSITGPEHRYEANATALSVPYPSGLRRLRAADPTIEVVLIEHASRGLDRAAAEEGIGYLDLRGRGRLVGPNFVYVVPPIPGSIAVGGPDVDDGANGAMRPDLAFVPAYSNTRKGTVSPFAPKASRVVRALLSDPARRWRVSELADQVRMNPGNVHRVLGALTDRGFVERDQDLYVLQDRGSLLEAWAENAARLRFESRLVIPVRGELREEVERILDALQDRAVVSGELAAELYAPYLAASHATVHCIDEGAWETARLAAEAGPRPLRPHGQVAVDLAEEGVGDFGERRFGLPLVSPAQLYVELSRERGRAREAAEHVRREVLKF